MNLVGPVSRFFTDVDLGAIVHQIIAFTTLPHYPLLPRQREGIATMKKETYNGDEGVIKPVIYRTLL